MSKKPLAAQHAFWLQQLSVTGERSFAKVLDTLLALGVPVALVQKVMEGTTWQGAIDSLTPIRAVADVTALAQLCAQRGAGFAPVIVPRGRAGEATQHGAIAEAAGVLVIDAEPFAGYFDQAPHSTLPGYLRDVRAAAPDAYLILQPDPRPYAVGEFPPEACAPYVDAFAPQHYIGWTQVGWTDIAAEIASFNRFAATGRDLFVTLWGEGDLTLARTFYDAVRARVLGVQWFAFGAMSLSELQTAATFPLPLAPQPQPPPHGEPTNDDLLQCIRYLLAEPPALGELAAYIKPFQGVTP